MSALGCKSNEVFSAYFCVTLFDSIGWEIHPQDLQESSASMGRGIYCTLDLQKAKATGKDVLIVEFEPTSVTRSWFSSKDLATSTRGPDNGDWRSNSYSGVLFDGTEICLRAECINALYRREWTRDEYAWQALSRLMTRLQSPPLSIDSSVQQTEAAWMKALERLKWFGDQQVQKTRDRLERCWLEQMQRDSEPRCTIM
eukprot:gnl/MRDRNA2_/MRDRNA2_102607_c0_seq1.p1 gnl/MRDRNA2_/MRDRNA2_102607_c0~~gnl/MRDRNA2_/MRDRNA2_102607_c0_seq1.p1  ORF type:complete len:199 (-),score=40.88 gnl/MRDRNA2_/MRDRNA2_102607_c0_seq1:1-597(-)